MPEMTFHESYGSLPKNTLRLIKKYNVSPADFDMMLDMFAAPSWDDIDEHIVSNSPKGMYQPRYF